MKIWMTVLHKLKMEKDCLSVTNKCKLKYSISQGL